MGKIMVAKDSIMSQTAHLLPLLHLNFPKTNNKKISVLYFYQFSLFIYLFIIFHPDQSFPSLVSFHSLSPPHPHQCTLPLILFRKGQTPSSMGINKEICNRVRHSQLRHYEANFKKFLMYKHKGKNHIQNTIFNIFHNY